MLDYYFDTLEADLIPLRKYVQGSNVSKLPESKLWTKTEVPRSLLETYIEAGHSVGFRMKSSELVIDVEVATEDGHDVDGRDAFEHLCRDFAIDLDDVPVVSSPKGGKHYYFRIPEGSRIVNQLDTYPGIDFLSYGRQVVAAGSKHWQGGYYELDGMTLVTGREPPLAPSELVNCLLRPERTRNPVEGGILSHEELESLLSLLDAKDYGSNDAWFGIMAACHHAGGPEAYEIFESWSWSDDKYKDDPSIKVRWNSLTSDKPGGITYGLLFRDVREKCIATGNTRGLNLLNNLEAANEFHQLPKVDEDGTLIAPIERHDVYVSDKLREHVDETLVGLQACDDLYYRAGRFVQVMQEQNPPAWQQHAEGAWTSYEIQRFRLHEIISDYVKFMKLKPRRVEEGQDPEFDEVTISCPLDVLNALYVRKNPPGIPVLHGVTQAPCMLPGGFILQESGFNSQYGILYRPNQKFEPVPEEPTRGDALEAMEALHEVVEDFPFINNAHRSVWLAALLTMFCRHSTKGSTPLFFFDGNTSGVGKSLLIDSVGYIALGRQTPKTSYPHNDEEMEKRLTAIVMSAAPIQLFDNVPNNKSFGSASLDAAVTSGVWKGRILGSSEMTGEMPVTTVFCATGNNLRISADADAERRIAYCRLSYNGEDPSTRTDFRHANLPSWILQNRARLTRAALTILKAFHVAGRPKQRLEAWGSFEAWSEQVRSPLVWLNQPDPIETKELMRAQANDARDALHCVVQGWREVAGNKALRTSEVLDLLAEGGKDKYPMMSYAMEILDEKNQQEAAVIGKKLATYAYHNADGWVLEKAPNSAVRRWQVVRSKEEIDFMS